MPILRSDQTKGHEPGESLYWLERTLRSAVKRGDNKATAETIERIKELKK